MSLGETECCLLRHTLLVGFDGSRLTEKGGIGHTHGLGFRLQEARHAPSQVGSGSGMKASVRRNTSAFML